MNISPQPLQRSYEKEQEKEHEEISIVTYICDNTDSILDPIDQMTFALNETAIKYDHIVVLKDAP